jgi:hypothetical protein
MAVLIFLVIFFGIVGLAFVIKMFRLANRAHRSLEDWLHS